MLHTLLVVFVFLTPFVGSNYFLLLHSIIVPFIMIHWIFNDNTCALTIMEQQMRSQIYGKSVSCDDCFVGKLVKPVYDFKANNEDSTIFIYSCTIFLWLVCVTKLYSEYKRGNISSFVDLLNIHSHNDIQNN
jgi:hypothetical protein